MRPAQSLIVSIDEQKATLTACCTPISNTSKTMYTPIPHGLHLYLCLISILFTQYAAGNVEKTIFVAPLPWAIPAESAAIDDLGLDRLSPADFMLRTRLNASFPTDEEPYGTESWFYLEDLMPGQRYEVRICWMATVLSPSLHPPKTLLI